MTMKVSLVLEGDATGAKKATEETRQAVSNLKKETATAGAAMSRSARSGARELRSVAKAAQLSTHQMQNMSFQLNDIAMGLATGQNPFRVLIQQGAQINQIFAAGTGLRVALSQVGAGIMQFIANPLNIALVAFTGVTVAATWLFSTITGEGSDAIDVLEEHEKTIKAIKQAYGGATKELKAYARASAEELSFMGEQNITRLRGELKSLSQELVDSLAIGKAGNLSGYLKQFNRLNRDMRVGRASVRDFRDEVSALARASDDPALKELADKILKISDAAAKAEGALEAASSAVTKIGASGAIAALDDELRLIKLSNVERRIEKELRNANVAAGTSEAGIISTRVRALQLEKEAIKSAVKAKREAAASAKRAVSTRQRERQSVIDLTARLRDEVAILRETDPVQREIIKHRKTLASATSTQAGEIRNLIAVKLQEKEADKQRKKDREAAIHQMDEIRNTARGVAGGIFDDMKRGASGAEILTNALGRVQQKLLDMALDQAINSLFGKTGTSNGGLLGNLFSGLFKGFSGGGVKASVGHQGARIGAPGGQSRIVDPSIFIGAPRHHGGAQLGADEVPFIGKKGELVGWPDQFAKAFGGGGLKIEYIDQRSSDAPKPEFSKQTGPDGTEVIRILVRDQIAREWAPGGINTRSASSIFALNPAAGIGR